MEKVGIEGNVQVGIEGEVECDVLRQGQRGDIAERGGTFWRGDECRRDKLWGGGEIMLPVSWSIINIIMDIDSRIYEQKKIRLRLIEVPNSSSDRPKSS